MLCHFSIQFQTVNIKLYIAPTFFLFKQGMHKSNIVLEITFKNLTNSKSHGKNDTGNKSKLTNCSLHSSTRSV